MPILHHYRIKCTTENEYVFCWDKETPTSCPNNGSHTIDENDILIIDTEGEEKPKDQSGKERVHQTSRPLGLETYFTGTGDDDTNCDDVGGGVVAKLEHSVGGGSINPVYLDFNINNNESFLHKGYVFFKGCTGDEVTLEIVPRVVAWEEGTDTNFNVYSGIIVAAAGDGTCNITGDLTSHKGGLVYMPDDDQGDAPENTFWASTWNGSVFSAPTYDSGGNGRYNIFSQEKILKRFVNKIPLIGDGFIQLHSSDTAKMGNGMRLKLSGVTKGDDHDWSASCVFVMHRDKTT